MYLYDGVKLSSVFLQPQFPNMEQADIREVLLTDRQECVDGEENVVVERIYILLLSFLMQCEVFLFLFSIFHDCFYVYTLSH